MHTLEVYPPNVVVAHLQSVLRSLTYNLFVNWEKVDTFSKRVPRSTEELASALGLDKESKRSPGGSADEFEYKVRNTELGFGGLYQTACVK